MTPAELVLRLQLNVVITLRDDHGTPWLGRVLHRLENAATVWLWPLDQPPQRLRCRVMTLKQIVDQFIALVPAAEDALQVPMPIRVLSPATARGLKKNRKIVAALEARMSEFFIESGLNRQLLVEIASDLHGAASSETGAVVPAGAVAYENAVPGVEKGTSPASIERTIARWFHGGRSDAALMPHYGSCGHPGAPRFAAEGRKLGRPSLVVAAGQLAASEDHRSTTPEDRAEIFDLVDHVLIKRKGNADDVVQAWHELHNVVRFVDTDGKARISPLPLSATLSERTVRHWVAERLKEQGMFKKRVGERTYALKFRPRVHRQYQFDGFAGLRCQTDAMSIDDVEVVSRLDDTSVLGTMHLYAGVDAVTTMTAGAFMSLRKPSELCVAQALLNVALPKQPLLDRYGLTQCRWDADGEYAMYDVDWGPDFSSWAATELVGRTKITWTNVGRGRPDQKPSVESIMATLQRWPKWFRRALARNDVKAPRPKLTQHELALAMLLSILERNEALVPTKFLDAAAIEDGLREPSRAAYHEWARARGGWPMPVRAPNNIRLSYLPRKAAYIADHGVNVGGFYFNLPSELSRLLIRHGRRQRPAICVVWNDELFADTWAYDLSNGSAIQLTPLHALQRFATLSWPELEALKVDIALARHWALPAWRDARAQIDAERERAGLSPLGGRRLSSSQPLLVEESLPTVVLKELKEGALEYEGERGGLDELCRETAVGGWNYAE